MIEHRIAFFLQEILQSFFDVTKFQNVKLPMARSQMN